MLSKQECSVFRVRAGRKLSASRAAQKDAHLRLQLETQKQGIPNILHLAFSLSFSATIVPTLEISNKILLFRKRDTYDVETS